MRNPGVCKAGNVDTNTFHIANRKKRKKQKKSTKKQQKHQLGKQRQRRQNKVYEDGNMSVASGNISGTRKNKQGGWYHPGDTYPHSKKIEILEIFLEKWADYYPREPTYAEMAKVAKVGENYIKKVLTEFKETGTLADPQKQGKKNEKLPQKRQFLMKQKRIFY